MKFKMILKYISKSVTIIWFEIEEQQLFYHRFSDILNI